MLVRTIVLYTSFLVLAGMTFSNLLPVLSILPFSSMTLKLGRGCTLDAATYSSLFMKEPARLTAALIASLLRKAKGWPSQEKQARQSTGGLSRRICCVPGPQVGRFLDKASLAKTNAASMSKKTQTTKLCSLATKGPLIPLSQALDCSNSFSCRHSYGQKSISPLPIIRPTTLQTRSAINFSFKPSPTIWLCFAYPPSRAFAARNISLPEPGKKPVAPYPPARLKQKHY
mmetsp:Transcript_8917/g.13012  ORF Transcript_8917/g.13012 Transcript_8917/m.13012 type:complete len:229 (+) Transcript_8917:1243-1929(+)